MAISTTPVHSVSYSGGSAVTNNSFTITAAPYGNTMLVMALIYRSPAGGVTSVSCTNTTGWAKVAGITFGTYYTLELWAGYCTGTSGTILLLSTATAAMMAASYTEWSGVLNPAGTTGSDGSATKSGTSTTPTTNTYSSTVANDLLVCCEGHLNSTAPTGKPGGIWTDLTGGSWSGVDFLMGEYAVPRPAGAASASWTITSAAWATIIAGFLKGPTVKVLTSTPPQMAAGIARMDEKDLEAQAFSAVASLNIFTCTGWIASTADWVAGMMRAPQKLLASIAATFGAGFTGGVAGNQYTSSLSASMSDWAAAIAKWRAWSLASSMASMVAAPVKSVSKYLSGA